METERDTAAVGTSDCCCSPPRTAPREPSSAMPTARVRKALHFQTPAQASRPSADTPATGQHTKCLPSSSVASSKSHGEFEVRDTAASGGEQRSAGDGCSAAKPRTGTCVKVVKSRFMEPHHSSSKSASARRASVGSAMAGKPTDKRPSLPPTTRPTVSGGAKESLPDGDRTRECSGSGSGGSQAELRARLAAFRAGKGGSEPAPAPTGQSVSASTAKPPLKGHKPAKRATRSASPVGVDERNVGEPFSQNDAAINAQEDGDVGGDEDGGRSSQRESSSLAPSAVARDGPASNTALDASKAAPNATHGKSYTRDDFARDVVLLRWQELQWACLRKRLETALAAQEGEAKRSLTRAGAVIVALQRHVAQQRTEANRLRLTASLDSILSAELPELRALQALEADLRQGVSHTSALLHAALLQVPLIDGAVVGSEVQTAEDGAVNRGTVAVREQLRRGGGALDSQLGAITQLLHQPAGGETEDAKGLASLGALSQELQRTATAEAHLGSQCASLLDRMEELSMHERSLQVHLLQLSAVAEGSAS